MSGILHYLGRPAPADPGLQARTELRSQVRRLEIRARQTLQAGLTGQYQSAFRGRGLEIEEVRDYRPGDDVRTIDWNVTARTGSLHVKVYREERDLTVLLLVDLSASTRFGSGVMTVHDLITEVASLFALAAAHRDRVGAVLFDDGVRTMIPPRRGWRHGLRVVREVLAASPAGRGTALPQALRAAGRTLHRRGVVILLVDQACPLPRRRLIALNARHDVVLVRVGDQLATAGFPAPLPAVDTESGRRGMLSARPAEAAPLGIDLIELSTGDDYLPAVREMLARRECRYAH